MKKYLVKISLAGMILINILIFIYRGFIKFGNN